eukprot:TRINITY_DN20216_c0_g1_i3.p1 TRINITY_DN20216_c0_g1~~TRINITY_DN20216_c0_g1_i3.p1  ORF type:complete len:233 (-),score=24.56 TRINITY_DN20216_c0_g1_i3:67-765(-)
METFSYRIEPEHPPMQRLSFAYDDDPALFLQADFSPAEEFPADDFSDQLFEEEKEDTPVKSVIFSDEDSRENEEMQDIEKLSEEEGGMSTAACSMNSNSTLGSLDVQLDFIFESVKRPRTKVVKPKKRTEKGNTRSENREATQYVRARSSDGGLYGQGSDSVFSRENRTPWRTNLQMVLGPKAKASQSAAHLTSSSVSYTHLRAHETSLHLVCRLLLEKKKKKTTPRSRNYS